MSRAVKLSFLLWWGWTCDMLTRHKRWVLSSVSFQVWNENISYISYGIFALTCFAECRRESALSANVSPDHNMNARNKRNFERGKFNIIGMCNIGCAAMLLFDGAFFLFSLSTEPCVQRPNPFRGQKKCGIAGLLKYTCVYIKYVLHTKFNKKNSFITLTRKHVTLQVWKLLFDWLHQFGCCEDYKWRLLLHEL